MLQLTNSGSTHQVHGSSKTTADEPSGISSTLGSPVLHPHSAAIVPSETRNPRLIGSHSSVSRQPNTHAIGTPNTPILGAHGTNIPGTPNTHINGDASAMSAFAPEVALGSSDAVVLSEPNTAVLSTPVMHMPGTPDMHVSGVPNTVISTNTRERAQGAPRHSHKSGLDRDQSQTGISSESSVLDTQTLALLDAAPGYFCPTLQNGKISAPTQQIAGFFFLTNRLRPESTGRKHLNSLLEVFVRVRYG